MSRIGMLGRARSAELHHGEHTTTALQNTRLISSRSAQQTHQKSHPRFLTPAIHDGACHASHGLRSTGHCRTIIRETP